MIGIAFIIFAGILYGAFCWTTFHDGIRSSNYFVWIGIAYAILANTSWVYLTKLLTTHKHIVFYSLAWDIVMALVGVAIPILFFGMKFTRMSIIGILIIITGVITLKLGEA